MDNQLTVILNENRIEKKSQSELKEIFVPFFEEAEKMGNFAKEIKVTSAAQKDLMGRAREIRLELKRIRTTVENRRKELKEDSLRYGKAIDGLANVIKYLIVPIEEHLWKQENFIDIKEKERKDKIESERLEKLSRFEIDVSYVNLREMTEDQFAEYYKDQERIFEAKKAEEKRIENERRIEAEKRREEQAELERLRKEKAEQDRKEQRERAEKEKEEQDRLQAPDRKKLKILLNDLTSISIPQIKSIKYRFIANTVYKHLKAAESALKKGGIT